MSNELSELQQSLGIKFKELKLLEQAFYHRSYLNEFKGELISNERLEFLGDSVLSLITSETLFNLRKDDAEGDLTNLRAFGMVELQSKTANASVTKKNKKIKTKTPK